MKTFTQKQLLDWAKKQPADRPVDMGKGLSIHKTNCLLAQFFKSRRSIKTTGHTIALTNGNLQVTGNDVDIARVNLTVSHVFDLFKPQFISEKTFGGILNHLEPQYNL